MMPQINETEEAEGTVAFINRSNGGVFPRRFTLVGAVSMRECSGKGW